jgi:outer membrane lipoprotein-sorting protein
LRIEYLGIRKVKETGDRLCWALRRTNDRPEEDGVLEGTFYFDKETWLQTGVVLKGEDNKLIGEYMFRDVVLNPTFKPNQFTRDVLLASPNSSASK